MELLLVFYTPTIKLKIKLKARILLKAQNKINIKKNLNTRINLDIKKIRYKKLDTKIRKMNNYELA